MAKVIIIAHRGAVTETTRGNTLEAFKRAVEFGAEMVEMDVRRTKDNVFVTHHENSINNVFIKNITYKTAKDLAHKNGYELPKLENILKEITGEVKFDFELKEEGYESEFIDFLYKKIPDNKQYILTSFNDRSITLIKNKDPEITAGLLLGERDPDDFIETRVSEIFPFKRVEECKADFIALHWRLLPAGLLWRAEKRGIPVYLWGIKPQTNLGSFLKHPALKGIITDKFEKIQEMLKNPDVWIGGQK